MAFNYIFDNEINGIKGKFIREQIIEKDDFTKKFFYNFTRANFVNFLHWLFVKLSDTNTFNLKYDQNVEGMVYLQESDYRQIFSNVLKINLQENDIMRAYYNNLLDFMNNLNEHQIVHLAEKLHTFDFIKNYNDLPRTEYIESQNIPDYETNFSDDQNRFVNKEDFITTTYMSENYYTDENNFEEVLFSILFKLKHKNGNILGYDYINDSNLIITNYQFLKFLSIITDEKYEKSDKIYHVLMNMSEKQLTYFGV